MRIFSLIAFSAGLACVVIRGADWPAQSGNPQRDGWARAEKAFTRENAKDIELLYKYKADNQPRGLNALTSPMINGMLITYLGFKEMLVFGGSSDNVYSVDADLNRLIWKTHFPWKAENRQAASTSTCPGGLTASLAMPGSSTASAGRGPGRGGTGLFATGFGRSGVFIAVSGDGYLHALNTSTGADKIPPVKFLHPNAKVSSITLNDGVIYAATEDSCDGSPNALYALDMSGEENKVYQFEGNVGGASISPDGTVYTQYDDTVVALTKDLKVVNSFKLPARGPVGATPLIFTRKGKELLIAAGPRGQLFLLDAKSLAPLAHTDPAADEFRGTFASWEDADTNTRWVYAASDRGVVAFQVEAELTRVWVSRKMIAPAAPVTANGLVFALSTGDKHSARATLYALDGVTGKELYSSGNLVTAFSHGSGLAVANRRIYFTTHDNVVYCFGFMSDQPQLTGK